MQNLAIIDFETRSAADIKKCGAWVYSKDYTTKVLCMAYILPGETEPKLWHCAHPRHNIEESPEPTDLFEHIKKGFPVEAHNVFFEYSIWTNQMEAFYGWPTIKHEQWRCSAARAAAVALPRSLEEAAKAAKISVEKDMEGRRLMLKMCKPRNLRKEEKEDCISKGIDPSTVILWHEEKDDLHKLWEYCKTDVLTEHALSEVIPELTDSELAIWQVDQAMNKRGLLLDKKMADAAIAMAAKEKTILNRELETLTGIQTASKRNAIKQWLDENEKLTLPDTAAATLEWYLERVDMSDRAKRVIQLVMEANKTSTRKYNSMGNFIDHDSGRVYDLLMYHGASTGRWSGKGIQFQNFPSRNLSIGKNDWDMAAQDIKDGDIEWCRAIYGSVMNFLSHALRGTIIAPPGRDLIVADYSSIEARVVLWLGEENASLDLLRSGGDIYCDMASDIYGHTVTKKEYPMKRQFGKQAILGLGYGMGFLKFFLTCRSYNIFFLEEEVIRIMGASEMASMINWVKDYLCKGDGPYTPLKKANARKAIASLTLARENPDEILHELALMKYVVDVYRGKCTGVVQLWYDQERAALEAMKTNREVKEGRFRWMRDGMFLQCELPSGRLLSYPDPQLKMQKTSWGKKKLSLSYMTIDSKTKKWSRTHTYGGKIVENQDQGISRDITANATLLAEKSEDYDPLITIHDELICEVDEDRGSVEDFEKLMTNVPAWAAGCPIGAEGGRFKRYRKM